MRMAIVQGEGVNGWHAIAAMGVDTNRRPHARGYVSTFGAFLGSSGRVVYEGSMRAFFSHTVNPCKM